MQRHHEEIITRLEEIKKKHEQTLRDSLDVQNEQINRVKSQLEMKKKQLLDLVKFMEESSGTMSDYSFVENHKELTELMSDLDVDMKRCEQRKRFRRGKISDKQLKCMVGKIIDTDEVIANEIGSFRYEHSTIIMLESFTDDDIYIKSHYSDHTKLINKKGQQKKEFKIKPNDLCVSRSSVYFTDVDSRSIARLSPSGSVSVVLKTDPLLPGGICSQRSGGLLVTLNENTSQWMNSNSDSKHLVRHVSLTGDTIREYEYTPDGKTKLFTLPVKVAQNGNSDICVVNWTSRTKGNLVILSSAGHIRSIYSGQTLRWNFLPFDVVCDSFCYILVSDRYNERIHLLSPDGEILKYLLNENEVNFPTSISLFKSNLRVGNENGLVKVFKYENSVS
ncbi:uncharacterized protein LOC134259167 [Saccostrea cucullata]|uniref:uncharacterized protein LOC134259167 n=1 Tax=Saccostrea cuccullata TaxID=36930 RepID=UPI002ED0F0E2